MTKRIPSFNLKDDYCDSVSLWRFAMLAIFFAFLATLGVSFVHLRFKVRDLKIAINATEERIDKLRERENALQAVIQTRAHEWTLKQTAVQRLGMIDFNPQQILHLEYPDSLLANYRDVTKRYKMDQMREDDSDPIRMMLNRFTIPTASASPGVESEEPARGAERSAGGTALARANDH